MDHKSLEVPFLAGSMADEGFVTSASNPADPAHGTH